MTSRLTVLSEIEMRLRDLDRLYTLGCELTALRRELDALEAARS